MAYRPQEKKKPFFSCCAGEEDKKTEAYVDVADKKPVYAPPRTLVFIKPYIISYVATGLSFSTSSKG